MATGRNNVPEVAARFYKIERTVMTNLSFSRQIGLHKQHNYKSQHKTLRFASPTLIVIGALIFSTITSSGLSGWQEFVANRVILKYIPLCALLFAVVLSALNLTVNQIIGNLIKSFTVNGYLTVFFVFAFSGAYYARAVVGQETSYFSQAVMIFSFIGSYFVFVSLPNKYWLQIRMWIVKTFTVLAFIAVILVVLNISRGLSRSGKTEPGIVLLLMQGVPLVYYFQAGIKKYWFIGILAFLTLLTLKNSALLTFMAVCFLLYLFPSKSIRKISISNVIGMMFIVLLVLLVVGSGYFLLRSGYSDGNIGFRSTIYTYRFEEFLKSPVSGHFFRGETSYIFEKKYNGASVPSHSDVLDVMAQGGAIGLVLFVGTFMRMIALLLKTRVRMIKVDLLNFKLISWQLAFLAPVIILFSFNSQLGTPSTAFIIWVSMAFGHRLAHPLPS